MDHFDTWRRDLLDRLRKASFAAWPAKPFDATVQALGTSASEGRETTEDGIQVFWRWFPGKNKDAMPWLLVLNPGDESKEIPAWAIPRIGDASTMLLCPRGVGPVAWTRRVFPNTIERSLPLLGATSDSGGLGR